MGGRWCLEGRALRDGEQVEVYDPSVGGWRPAVVQRGATSLEFKGTSDADAGHHSASPEHDLTLEHLAAEGIEVRRAEVYAHSSRSS